MLGLRIGAKKTRRCLFFDEYVQENYAPITGLFAHENRNGACFWMDIHKNVMLHYFEEHKLLCESRAAEFFLIKNIVGHSFFFFSLSIVVPYHYRLDSYLENN